MCVILLLRLWVDSKHCKGRINKTILDLLDFVVKLNSCMLMITFPDTSADLFSHTNSILNDLCS